MKGNFYISDLDGTLLNSNGTLSSYTQKSLDNFYQDDILFTIATGRSYGSMRHAMGISLKSNPAVITYDGGLITPFLSVEPLYFQSIDSKIVKEVIQFSQKEEIEVYLDILRKGRTEFIYEGYSNQHARMFVNSWRKAQEFSYAINVPLITPYAQMTVLSLAIIDSPSKMQHVFKSIKDCFKSDLIRFDYEKSIFFDSGQADILWILPKNSCKKKALKEYCLIKNINLQDITYFGDEMNDLGIFQLEEVRKIAVANAKESLLERADIVIGTNENDSVVKFIKNEISS